MRDFRLPPRYETFALLGCYASFIKVKVKVKFNLEQTTKAQMWSRDIAVLFLQPRC
jgi:hypothetical protein